jgi:hypothetical protein
MEVLLKGVSLRVHEDGKIERWYKKHNWKELIPNYSIDKRSGYKTCQFMLGGKLYKNSRIIATVYLGLELDNLTTIVDHINNDETDNRVENLRLVNHTINAWNTQRKGVHYRLDNRKWRAYITVHRKQISLGQYDTEQEATNAYDEAKPKYHLI